MLDATFVKALAEEFRGYEPKTFQIDGRNYLVRPQAAGGFEVVDLPRPETMPSPVILGTLDGFVRYAAGNRDGLKADTLIAVVISHGRVELQGPLTTEFRQRPTYAVADLDHLCGGARFTFGSFIEPETFVIQLQAFFAPSEHREAILKVVGNLRDEQVRQADDDGTTQTVTARAGVVMAREVPVPNPVVLAPFRTFREVAQPESRFILRMRRGAEGQLPTCALFEADGSAWKLEAAGRISDYLNRKLDGSKIAVIA